jgi:hypothetical protein
MVKPAAKQHKINMPISSEKPCSSFDVHVCTSSTGEQKDAVNQKAEIYARFRVNSRHTIQHKSLSQLTLFSFLEETA